MEIQTYNLAAPADAMQVAKILQDFVNQQKLTVQFAGKPYALVEAWQFAGSQLGLYPILIGCLNQSSYENRHFEWTDKYNNPKSFDTKHFKYEARVEIRRYSDDKIMSQGVMCCTNDEYGKHEFKEYAIQSMAQTRAQGKAWRLLIGWIMKAAGFEQTPAEEMDEERQQFFENCPKPEEKKLLYQLAFTARYHDDKKENELRRLEAIATIGGCTDYNLFNRIENRLRDLQPSIDEIVNPSQGQISAHLKKTL